MPDRSAGILFHRHTAAQVEVLLVHPGGPFWRHKDIGAWQMPKGTIEPDEDPAIAARREVEEELGVTASGPLRPLATVRQSGGKLVEAFAVEQDIDVSCITSNHFELEWPPRSGRIQSFPEVDEARWFTLAEAEFMMLPSQRPLLKALAAALGSSEP